MKTIKYFLLLILLFGFVFQSCNLSDITENLGNGYFYRDEGSEIKDILCEKPNGGQIPATVLSYDYNKDFIIAKQKPKLPQDILYEEKYNYKYGSSEFYYWLIIKDKYLVLGPFNLSEFNEVMKKYDVPNTLELNK